ncbi:MAG: hypothetical protein HYV42_00995 [Candidatus Magasanikbacteria bacterium]|nr:hypothetical protein [Candidatus Magasanikbacteria bacterium]
MLSEPAQQIINRYLHLPFKNLSGVGCPYFLNKGNRVRGGLRALIGKGSPEDIREEAMIISLRDKIELAGLNAEQLKKFLVDHRLGVDCSALLYYALEAECRARGLGKLKNLLRFPTQNPWRKLLIKLRPVENTSVRVFAAPENSRAIALAEAAAGDFIIVLNWDPAEHYDHIMLIHDVTRSTDAPPVLHYTHSLRWATDGRYHHGVRQGTIEVIHPAAPLTAQRWTEQGKTDTDNETFTRAQRAEKIELRRLKIL